MTPLTIGLFGFTVALAIGAYRKRKIGLVVWLALLSAAFFFTGKTAFLVLGMISAALLLGQPLFVLMGGLGMALLATVSGLKTFEEQVLVVRQLLGLAGKEVLLAIPFFVVAGELMTQGSLARRLIEFMKAAFGWIPGGLAVSAVAGCVFFAAISGSSPVTVVAIGSIMVPALIKAKYPEGFSIGLLTTAGSLGILIPPSIPMIVYCIMVSSATPIDPTDLFIAGVVPGLFIGALLAIYSVTQGVRFKIPREPFSRARLWEATRQGVWSLLLPVIILGGIYSGIFTATEASAVSVVYALAVEWFIHREMDKKKLLVVAEGSMTVMGSLLVIIALAIVLNYFLVDQQVPDLMVEWMKTLNLTPTTFLLVVNLLLLVVGMFMDIMSAILIIAPMLAPMAAAMGINPIHMGIIFIVNLEIGYLTPPVGLNLFVSSSLFKKGLGFVIRAVIPTVVIMLGSLAAITWVPSMSTGLVEALKEKPKAVVMPVFDAGVPIDSADAGSAAPKVKSLEEIMREAREKAAREAAGIDGGEAAAPPAPAPAPTEPPRVKSLEELMREAKEKTAREAAPEDAGT
ncbi:MAG: TRAP transporter large permease subunit [Archangium sp.]|nr:TRAP transporter large permease subunit [Archangium sp.]